DAEGVQEGVRGALEAFAGEDYSGDVPVRGDTLNDPNRGTSLDATGGSGKISAWGDFISSMGWYEVFAGEPDVNVVFTLTLPTPVYGDYVVNLPTLPDTSTPLGSLVNTFRLVMRSLMMVGMS